MRVTIKGLRLWVLMMAALLMAVVAGFLIYGRNRFRHIEKDLPGRLGINIQQTANAITFSQASQGHTLFTLKAARQVQLKSGHVLLHDVDITLYGPPGSGRADRIYGSDFIYDQANGVATSQGDVDIELRGMGSSGTSADSHSAAADAPDSNTIHVRTRGLTFVQKSGEATTAERVDFQLPRAAGSSVGADYNSKTGVLALNSQVKITTSSNGRSAVVGAGHATLLRASMQAFLVNATIDYETENGSSDEAIVYFRKDGTTEKVDARGHVRMRTDTGATMNSDTAHILMDPKSQPTQADLGGGVTFASAHDNQAMHGVAQEGTFLFASSPGPGQNTQTVLRHAEFRHDVTFAEELTNLPKDPRGRQEKQLHGQKVDVDFGPPAPGGQVQAREAVAEGNPVVTMRQLPSKGPQQTTRISGDHLVATLGAENTLERLDGRGNTRVLDDSTDGAHDTSRGDVLHTTFIQQPAPVQQPVRGQPPLPVAARNTDQKVPDKHRHGAQSPKTETALETAVQDGNVMLTETPAKKPGATAQPATMTGWADHAEYRAATQVLHLSGNPRITDSQSMQIAGNLIDYHRDTQDAAASGNVKATYTQQQKPQSDARNQNAPPTMGGNGPVHVIADRAALNHASNETFFYGTVHAPARMWQDEDLLLAPVIEIDRNKNLLKARGEDTGAAPVVNANFTSAMGPKHQQSPVRVRSQTLVYSDKDRQGDFHGTVTADQAQGTIHADDAVIYLKPAAASTGAAASTASARPASAAQKPDQGADGKGGAVAASRQNSQVDHVIATGHVIFTQPGRRGDGEKLVYTADDGKYVLTGTAAEPPKMVDRTRGTTTGAALIFNSQDDSVEVSGGKSSAVTETRAPR